MNKPNHNLEALAEKTLNFLRWVNITYGNLTHFDLMYINMAEKLLKIIIGTEDHKVHFLHKALFIAEERRSDIFEKAGKAGIVLKIDNHFNNWKKKLIL